MNILIVDDHSVVRRGLKEMLAEAFSDAVVGEAQTAQEGLALGSSEAWDAVILDINLPDRSGLEVLKELKRTRPAMPVLILTIHPEDQYAMRVLKAGADGYVSKDSADDDLIKAVRKVLAGGKYMSTSLAERLAAEMTGHAHKTAHEALSDREFQVLRMIALGKALTEIGCELSVSIKTVSSYRKRILEKLDMKANADLVRYAVEHGLIQ